MSYHSIHLIPDEDDLIGTNGVHGSLSGGIPAIKITKGLMVQFMPADHEFAVRYLNKLADEARKLAQQIAEAKR